MPPRASLTAHFSLADADNEVVCPLRNQDGTSCRKRCLGEKRYRSMQEHIRRAHPEYYLPKLPATKDSFELMISTPPHDPPRQDLSPHHQHHHSNHNNISQHSDPSGLSSPAYNLDAALSSFPQGYAHGLPLNNHHHDGGYYTTGDAEAAAIFTSMQAQARSSDEYRRGSLIPAASAAQALAQLHYHRGTVPDWAADNISQTFYADQNNDLKHNNFNVDPALDDPVFMQDPAAAAAAFSSSTPQHQSGLLPSSLARSPPDRPTTLPPMQRSLSRQHGRPRKTSLSQQARLSKHERTKSKELAKRNSGERKAFSVEPSAAALYGKRWEDLIDAATSATEEEDSRDLTPIPASPYQSPQANSRTSLPPFALGSQFQSFQASPLNRALTPPAADASLELQPFPSVESSLSSDLTHHTSTDSGSQFHIMNPASMDSSPMFSSNAPHGPHSQQQQHHQPPPSASQGPVQIYCAGCKKLNSLTDSFACTNCICGLCGTCVEALVDNQRNGRMSGCPRCQLNYGSFKQFQLDLR